MANSNSNDEARPLSCRPPRAVRRGGWRSAGALGGFGALLLAVLANSPDDVRARLAERAARTYAAARERHQAAATNAVLAWEFARACFDWAEFATNQPQRASIAQEGISAARRAVSNAPALAATYYYLGMNLGQLARTKTLGALPLVSEMERLFLRARELDPHFDHAGPDRNLGLLYLDAPGWPASIGSRSKARQHLRRAVELSPDYPENRLNLLEACLRWNDRETATQEADALKRIWPAARARWTGPDWEASWLDWERRWAAARAKLEKLSRGDDKE